MRRLFLFACAFLVFGTGTRAQQPPHLAVILDGLAGRTKQYYDRFISIICTETVQTQDLRSNLAPAGKPRTTVYELSVMREPDGQTDADFRVARTLLSVNGRRAARNQRTECTDPKTGTPDPLAFLLASNQPRYRFSIADAADGPPGARAIAYVETPIPRVRINWEGNCFQAEGGGKQGRVWFDPDTYDVVQVEERLSEPFNIPVPDRFSSGRSGISVQKSEMILRFTRVEFEQPDESLMLPASIETLQVLRGVSSLRIRRTLDNYRRFLTKSEIRPGSF